MATLDEHAKAGLQAIQEKRFDDAIVSFSAAVELDGTRPDIRHALGMAFLHRGDAGNALEPLRTAVQLAEPFEAPEHQALKREFHLTLATVQQLLDQVESARRTLEGILKRWPDTVSAHLQLGQLLMSSCRPTEGCSAYDEATDWLDKDQRKSAEALVGTVRAFLEAGHEASVFLEAHGDSYRQYFGDVAAQQEKEGWYAEAARMTRRPDGEIVPLLPEGARPWAFERVDLANPADGTVSSVYSESEPMVVGVEGLEPLAQVPITLPWRGFPFEVWVSTRCPWHWLTVIVQFQIAAPGSDLIAALEEVVGPWYLAGFNGEFGEKESGRFHYVTDVEQVGPRAASFVVDLGRAKWEAIDDLMRRLQTLHVTRPLLRVVFGEGRLPEDA